MNTSFDDADIERARNVILDIARKAEPPHDFLVTEIPEDATNAQLEEELRDLADLAWRMTVLQQTDLLARVFKRFPKLPRREAQRVFAAAVKECTEAARKEAEDAAKARAGGAEDAEDDEAKGRRPELDPNVMAVFKGSIREENLGYYERLTIDGVTERISTFALDVVRTVTQDLGPGLLVCRAIDPEGRELVKEWIIPARAWNSKRNFITALPHERMQWSGTDDETQGLYAHLTASAGYATSPRIKGAKCMGVHKSATGERRFVTTAGTLDEHGWMEKPDVVYLPPGGSSLANKLPRTPSPFDADAEQTLKDALEVMFDLHAHNVIVPLASFFAAHLFRSELMEDCGHSGFMLCNVYGTAGCGKTALTTDFFWRLFGGVEREEPLSATQTHFASTLDFASHNAVPIAIDEYKPVDMGKMADNYRRMLRRTYAGDTESRGRADQGINTYTFVNSPITMGETKLEEDQALIERHLYAGFDKNWLETHKEAQKKFRAIVMRPLQRSAPMIWRWRLGVDTKALLAAAEAKLAPALERVGCPTPPIRVRLTLLQMTFGTLALEALAAAHASKLGAYDFDAIVRSQLGEVLGVDEDTGAFAAQHVSNAFDDFMADAASMAQHGEIREGVHYCERADGTLFVWLRGVEHVRAQWRQRMGGLWTSPGNAALLRIARENAASGRGYVIDPNARMTMGATDGPGVTAPLPIAANEAGYLRGVVVDRHKAPSALGLSGAFHVTARRPGWGGARPMSIDDWKRGKRSE